MTDEERKAATMFTHNPMSRALELLQKRLGTSQDFVLKIGNEERAGENDWLPGLPPIKSRRLIFHHSRKPERVFEVEEWADSPRAIPGVNEHNGVPILHEVVINKRGKPMTIDEAFDSVTSKV